MYTMYNDQDVTTVARYVNQKGCYYTLQPFIMYQKYCNKWMSGFYIMIWERMWRKQTIENDIPYSVLRVALTSHVGAPRWTRLIPTCTVSNHVSKMGKTLVVQQTECAVE